MKQYIATRNVTPPFDPGPFKKAGYETIRVAPAIVLLSWSGEGAPPTVEGWTIVPRDFYNPLSASDIIAPEEQPWLK